jgi:hypothetical protein
MRHRKLIAVVGATSVALGAVGAGAAVAKKILVSAAKAGRTSFDPFNLKKATGREPVAKAAPMPAPKAVAKAPPTKPAAQPAVAKASPTKAPPVQTPAKGTAPGQPPSTEARVVGGGGPVAAAMQPRPPHRPPPRSPFRPPPRGMPDGVPPGPPDGVPPGPPAS